MKTYVNNYYSYNNTDNCVLNWEVFFGRGKACATLDNEKRSVADKYLYL